MEQLCGELEEKTLFFYVYLKQGAPIARHKAVSLFFDCLHRSHSQ